MMNLKSQLLTLSVFASTMALPLQAETVANDQQKEAKISEDEMSSIVVDKAVDNAPKELPYDVMMKRVESVHTLLLSEDNFPILQAFAKDGWSEEGFSKLVDTCKGANPMQKETLVLLKPAFKEMLNNPETREAIQEGYQAGDKLKDALLIGMGGALLMASLFGSAFGFCHMERGEVIISILGSCLGGAGISFIGSVLLPETVESKLRNDPSIQLVIDKPVTATVNADTQAKQSGEVRQSNQQVVVVAHQQRPVSLVNQTQHVR